MKLTVYHGTSIPFDEIYPKCNPEYGAWHNKRGFWVTPAYLMADGYRNRLGDDPRVIEYEMDLTLLHCYEQFNEAGFITYCITDTSVLKAVQIWI